MNIFDRCNQTILNIERHLALSHGNRIVLGLGAHEQKTRISRYLAHFNQIGNEGSNAIKCLCVISKARCYVSLQAFHLAQVERQGAAEGGVVRRAVGNRRRNRGSHRCGSRSTFLVDHNLLDGLALSDFEAQQTVLGQLIDGAAHTLVQGSLLGTVVLALGVILAASEELAAGVDDFHNLAGLQMANGSAAASTASQHQTLTVLDAPALAARQDSLHGDVLQTLVGEEEYIISPVIGLIPNLAGSRALDGERDSAQGFEVIGLDSGQGLNV